MNMPLTYATGKQWHERKSAFRPKAGKSSYAERDALRKAMAATKAKEKEMKEEKETERQVRFHLCRFRDDSSRRTDFIL